MLFKKKSRILNKEGIHKTIQVFSTNQEATASEIQEGFNKSKKIPEKLGFTMLAIKKTLNITPYDTQIDAAIEMINGKTIEMDTGEGKTLAAIMAAMTMASQGKQVMVVSANEYLVNRDFHTAEKVGEALGIKVGNNLASSGKLKEKIYTKDVVYSLPQDLAIDYLQDHMFYNEGTLPNKYDTVIIDEVDQVLLEMATAPIGINQEKDLDVDELTVISQFAGSFTRGSDFEVVDGAIEYSEKGIERIEFVFKIDNLYDIENIHLSEKIEAALTAIHLLKKDIDYVVSDGKVKKVDPSTGRVSEGIRFPGFLQSFLEIKEEVEVQKAVIPLVSISMQKYFQKYDTLIGMSGTVDREELSFLYGINKFAKIKRRTKNLIKDFGEKIYVSKAGKDKYIKEKAEKELAKKRPVMIITKSVEDAEKYAELLKDKNPALLTAKNHEQEADIFAKAGQPGHLTVATYMAGRGVDILISEESDKAGGIHLISTHIHEEDRINKQIKGRVARHGESGSAETVIALEEDPFSNVFNKLKKAADLDKDSLESVDSAFIKAQIRKILLEERLKNKEIRKMILEFDDIFDTQREEYYKLRQRYIDDPRLVLEDFYTISKDFVDTYFLEYEFSEKKEAYVQEFFEKLNVPYSIDVLIEDHFKNDFDDMKHNVLAMIVNMVAVAQNEYVPGRMSDSEFKNLLKEMVLLTLELTWRKHFESMELLRSGVFLRAIAGKDPLTEFKREAFHLYELFLERFRLGLMSSLNNLLA